MTSLALRERQALADTLWRVGPNAPTLCEGWLSRDLAAHLVVRDSRVDALPGIGLSGLAHHTAAVMEAYRQRPYAELVASVRSGPPRWNPLRYAPLADLVNLTEMVVHHEDVLRGTGRVVLGRRVGLDVEHALWEMLPRLARMTLRRSPVAVALRAPGFGVVPGGRGQGPVTITGEVVELVLWLFGRTAAARVELDGSAADVAALTGAERAV